MKYYKVLSRGGIPANGGTGAWFLPKGKRPGKWMPKIDDIELCESGYHGCRRQDLVHWLGEEIYEVEYKGSVIVGDNKVVGEQARLIRKIDTWNDRTARLFAADCAEKVLYIWEEKYPDDDRPKMCIEAVRSFANGKIGKDELAAAGAAAWYAAGSAAGSAAGAAAWYAAWDAAGSAAGAAAWYAAGSAAGAAAWEWQTNKLFEYLEE